MAAVSSPIGTFTKKIHSQPRLSVSAPPTSGPTATAKPVVAPQMPNAVPRSLGRELLGDQGERGGEHHRPADALEAAGDVQHRRRAGEAAQERGTPRTAAGPITKTRRRPSRSASEPEASSSAASASA